MTAAVLAAADVIRCHELAATGFIPADSIVSSGGTNPQVLNRHGYVNNNPTNFTDPKSHISTIDALLAGAIVAGLVVHPIGTRILLAADVVQSVHTVSVSVGLSILGLASEVPKWAY